MKSLDIFLVFSRKPGLKSQFPRASHTKERAMALVVGTETDGMRITQRKIHRGRTGLRRADKEGTWEGDEIDEDKVSARKQEIRTNFLKS